MFRPHQQDLLHQLVRRGGMEAREVDGRILRPLLTAGFAKREGARIIPTDQGRSAVEQASTTNRSASPARLNGRQEDVLRVVARSGRKVRVEEFDGRVVNALMARALVTRVGQHITATPAGSSYLESSSRLGAQRSAPSPGSGRAAMIMRALDILDRALPQDAEVIVGNILAGADDVIDGFRKYARSLSRPRRNRGD